MFDNTETTGDREIKIESNIDQTENSSVDTDKNNRIVKLAVGGLIGAAMGTIAVVLTDKKTAGTLDRTAKELGNTVKGATASVNDTIKSRVEKVKNKVSSLNNNNGTNSKSKVENQTDNFSVGESSSEKAKESIDIKPSESDAEKTSDVQVFQLYEEKLTAHKKQVKTGEVAIAKHVETYIAQISVPLEKERLVIEQVPVDPTLVASGEVDFTEGELARIEIYEQTAEVEKKAFVREQIRIRKEVERKALEVEEKIRREELDLEIQDMNDNDKLPVRTVNEVTASE